MEVKYNNMIYLYIIIGLIYMVIKYRVFKTSVKNIDNVIIILRDSLFMSGTVLIIFIIDLIRFLFFTDAVFHPMFSIVVVLSGLGLFLSSFKKYRKYKREVECDGGVK